MAQQLCGADEAVAALIIIDSPEAPLEDSRQRAHVGVRKLLLYYPGRIRYFLRRRRLFYTLRMKIRNDAAYAVERLLILFRGRAAGSRERRLRILRRLHTLAYHRYVAKPYAGTITIFWADGLPDITGEKQKWERLAAGGIEWYTFPSRHHELLKEPSIKQVALQLSDCLERTQTDIEDRTIS
jgi:thioesterase domain-containing protein